MKKIILISILFSFNLFASGSKSPSQSEEERLGIHPYSLGDRSCGQLDQKKCAISVKEHWDMVNFGCDRGLVKKWSWSKWKYYCRPGVRFVNRPIAYIAGSHKFQRELTKSKPLTMMSSVTPHNAMGYRKSGLYLMPNQDFSPTDLLNMGVRIISMDVHKFNGNFRVVHCSTSLYALCDRRGRYWVAYLEEIKNWLDKNRSEVVVILIEDYLYRDSKSFNYIIEKVIGKNRVLLDHEWSSYQGVPSLDWLRQRGKQLIIMNQNNSGGSLVTRQKRYPGWPRGYVKNFKPETCKMSYRAISGTSGESLKNGSWIGFMEDAGKILGIDPGWFYDGRKHTGEVTIQAIRDATKCGMTDIEMDWVDNNKMSAAIWSWATGEPRSWGKGKNCTKQRNGRWYGVSCTEKKYHACRHKTNAFTWRVTNKTGIFVEGPTNCKAQFGNDYYFALPTVGDQNEALRKAGGNNKDIWINFSTGINWSTADAQIRAASTSQTSVSNGVYNIRPEISGRYLTEVGTWAIQYSWMGTGYHKTRQQWSVEKQSDGYFIIRNKKTNRCLDSFSDGNGGRIGLWSCHKGVNQRWRFVNKGLNIFQLQNKRSNRCMDLNGSKRHNWNSMMNWKCYNVRQHYYKMIRQ